MTAKFSSPFCRQNVRLVVENVMKYASKYNNNKTGNSHISTLNCGLCLENLFLETCPLFSALILAVSTVISMQLILRSATGSLVFHYAKLTPQVLSAVLMEAPVPEYIRCLNWVNPFPLSSSLGWLKTYCLSQFPAFNVRVVFAKFIRSSFLLLQY